MSQSLVSVTIPESIITTVTQKLQDSITALQPVTIGLSAEQRQEIVKMGDKSKAYAEKVNTYFGSNPGFMPTYVNTAEYAADFVVPAQLEPLRALAQQFLEMLEDTLMAVGSDIMEVSNIYFNGVKQAARNGQPGAQAIYDDLKARYPGRPPKHDPLPGS